MPEAILPLLEGLSLSVEPLVAPELLVELLVALEPSELASPVVVSPVVVSPVVYVLLHWRRHHLLSLVEPLVVEVSVAATQLLEGEL